MIPEDIIAYTRNAHFHVADVDERTEAVTTYGSGLYLYDKPTGELTCIKNGVISNPYLTGLFVDQTGCIWIIEDYLGVKCLRMNSLRYYRHSIVTGSNIQDANHVRCLAPMGNGRLFCSNQMSNVYDYDIVSGRASFLKQTEKRVYAALTDRQGNEWIGTRGAGLFKNNQHQEGLTSQNIFQLREDDKDGIWIAMFEGGTAHLKANGEIKTFLKGKKCHDNIQDEEGNWWVAAEDSLYVVKGRRVDSVIKGFFVCLFRDRDDVIWAGSIGSGLVRCQDGKAYTVKSGLENDNIYAVVQDQQGVLWLGTEDGLSSINPYTEDIQNYHFSDSQLANVFSERAAVSLSDGRLLFGTHDGIVVIDNPQMAMKNSSPKTSVVGLLVNGENMDNLSSSALNFKYTENNLTFEYSNFQYATLGSVLYQYKLDGIEKEWCHPTKEHIAVYRRLSPGRYTFHVRSNNGMGVWGEETTMEVNIRQPWWNTWWAWTLYLVLLTVIVIVTFRILHLHRKLDMERRMSAFKRDFYNRVERELRNPVNVLQGATENVQLSGTSKTTVQSLRRGSKRILKLMDMIQQFHLLNDLEVQVQSEQDAINEETEQRFRDIQQAIHDEEKEFKELAPPPINTQTILIVEDDEDNLTHLSDTLNSFFRVVGCPSMSACETLVGEVQPALMLLDITADEKTARELTRRLKEEQPGLPIIHLSSFNDDAQQLRSLRSGAADYVVKPFSGKVLIERVRKAIVNVSSDNGEKEPDGHGVLTDVRDKRFLDVFRAVLAQHVADENFSVEQFAALMGLGRTQFYKRVKVLTGETPVQHLHRTRLEYAAGLLRDSSMTVEEVMLRSGFHSPTHFYQAFRKHFGMSPKALRESREEAGGVSTA